MIKIQIIVENDKIATKQDEKEVTLMENSLVIRELEKIKTDLVLREFDITEVEWDDENGDDENGDNENEE